MSGKKKRLSQGGSPGGSPSASPSGKKRQTPAPVAQSTQQPEQKKESQSQQQPQQPKQTEEPSQAPPSQAQQALDPSKFYGVLPLHQSQEQLVKGRVFAEIKDLDEKKANQSVFLRARLENSRVKGKLAFLVLRQGAYSVQGVFFQGDEYPADMLTFITKIPKESIIEVEGLLTTPKEKVVQMTQQTVEIQVQKIFIFTEAVNQLPLLIQDASRPQHLLQQQDEEIKKISEQIAQVQEELKKKETPKLQKQLETLLQKKSEAQVYATVHLSTRLDNRVLDLRVQAHNAVFRIQSAVTNLFRETLLKEGFTEIHSPKIIGGASEGGSQVFRLDYFNQKACMAQSPQLYKQMALSSDFDRVFEVGPVFRAENAHTHRHLTEFIGLDLEMTFYEHYHEVLDVIDKLFISIFDGLNKHFAKELEIVKRQYPFEPLKYKYPSLRLKYSEIVKILRESGENIGDFDDINTTQEKKLGELIRAKYDTDFYIVDKFPLNVRPFYSMPDPADPRYANAYDIFLRGEEIMSGAQRVHDSEFLIKRAKECGVDPETIKDYVNAFRYGMYPHAGGGIGLERVVMLFLGLKDIRQTSLFPRDPDRLAP